MRKFKIVYRKKKKKRSTGRFLRHPKNFTHQFVLSRYYWTLLKGDHTSHVEKLLSHDPIKHVAIDKQPENEVAPEKVKPKSSRKKRDKKGTTDLAINLT